MADERSRPPSIREQSAGNGDGRSQEATLRPAARLKSYLTLALSYVRLNLHAHLEYRAAFVSQVAAMFINDAVWVAFWVIFFNRFPVIRGWRASDVITLWSLTACGFGIAYAVCGNALQLATIISQGQLDVWMLYPRSLLPHILVGKMNPSACGDALFGLAVYLVFARPDAVHLIWFLLLVLSVATLFVGFAVLAYSLSFYLGNAATLAQQWQAIVVTFSTYPDALFDGWVKLLLFTAIPAGFVSYLPVRSLRSLSVLDGLEALAGSLTILLAGVAMFYRGLRSYESGNLLALRG